jgi:hypothetical protein
MANQVAALLEGEDYQHLFSWLRVLELKVLGSNVRLVTVEDAHAGSMDDVTVQHDVGTSMPNCYYQVKYHRNQGGAYSTQQLLSRETGKTSLLEKFWAAWKLLNEQEPARAIELHLVSNWSWDSNDELKTCLAGRDGRLTDAFFKAPPRSEIRRLRNLWQIALHADDAEFEDFMRSLRFRLGFYCTDDLEKRVKERMEQLHLKSDWQALAVVIKIVRDWITSGKQEISAEALEATLKMRDLYLPSDRERCMTIYLTTVKAQQFEIEPDYIIDWRDYFIVESNKRGHQLIDPSQWNTTLLPELEALETRVNQETDCRLIRARGLSRLSAWFAFGFMFSDVARYTIEIDQQGQLWRTDAKPSADFRLITTTNAGSFHGEVLDGEGGTVAVGMSVTGLLDEDVRTYLNGRTEKVAALLLLRPERELGRTCLQSAGDVAALADQAKMAMRTFVKKWQAKRLLLFYFGPLSGACFLGHRLNAVCQEVQIMEDQQPGYASSFLLK